MSARATALVRRAAVLACAALPIAGAEPALAQDAVRAEASAAPRTMLFGDELRVRVDVVLDPDLAAPASLELDTDFRPFTVEDIRREDERGSEAYLARYSISLRCLEAGCLPPEGRERRRFELPPVDVRFEGEEGEATLAAPLPRLWVESRLDPGEAREEGGRSYEERAVAPVSYPVAPGLASALLWIAAAGLALVGGVLAAYAATGSGPATLATPRRSPLKRALVMARRSVPREPAERRRALERLARELGRTGHPQLAERSGALAWSRPEPAGAAIEALLSDAERSIAAEP